ncbi:nucleoside/nucleotide kinase family protein [Pseudonocardia halophobica]|uniref:Nucleoside/nucleotide kinase family protein n=1 Tax=Pseudonocardia halophobica TaxID=29401 RepID=A0A9W6NXP4_9PSEU|nr:nucleoside/nucleotide kinase family protein [Pseudonocardia halophobica]GLL13109.1 nucleoside/nucleotide kinase family protein [Pseudonocardia halophobica]
MIDPVARATALAAGGRALLGIAGAPGSGKTTLAAHVAAAVPGAVHVPMDGFHLADVALDRLGRRDRKGAPDTFDAAGYLALLRRLRTGESGPVYAPMFERDLEQPLAGAIAVPPDARLVVTEGNYLLLPDEPWPAVAAELTEVWFCDLREELRLRRLVDRHVRFGKAPGAAEEWVRRVDGPNAERVAATRDRADLVVPSAVLETLRP